MYAWSGMEEAGPAQGLLHTQHLEGSGLCPLQSGGLPVFPLSCVRLFVTPWTVFDSDPMVPAE